MGKSRENQIDYGQRMEKLRVEKEILVATSLGPHLLNHVRKVSEIVDRIDRGETTFQAEVGGIVKIMDEISRVRDRTQVYDR